MKIAKPKARAERDLCPNIIKIEELCNGGEGHEGYFAKTERHDRVLWKIEGMMWIIPPITAILTGVITAVIIKLVI